MLTRTHQKKLFAVALISLTTLTAPAQVTGAGQLSAKPATASTPFARLYEKNASSTPNSESVSFLSVVTYETTGIGAGRIVAADLNGDGKMDMAVTVGSVTNTTGASIEVFLGNGDGNFNSGVPFKIPAFISTNLAVADVNGDGKPDILVSGIKFGSDDGAVGVFLGNGDGTFQPAVVYDSGGILPYSLAVADFNGDGKLDLVVADCSPYTGSSCGLFGILLGNGDGTFMPVVTYNSGGVGAWAVSAADLNGDGKPDLVIGNLCADSNCSGNGVVAVLLGNGDGTFKPPVTYDSGGRTLVPSVADINGDGQPDILVTNGSGKQGLGVLIGNGDGTFHPVITYDVGEKYVSSLAVADFNSDRKLDVVVSDCSAGQYTCQANGSVSVLLGNGDGTFQSSVIFSSGGWFSMGVAVADLNGDGRPDVLVANCAPNGGACNGSENGVVGVLLNNTPFCTTPPVITLSTTPTSLWPPNGQMAPVTVSGTITDTGCAVNAKSAAYVVTDEYGAVQPSGAVALGPGGSYSFTVLLQASRLGTDLNGRQYTITVRASDNAGNAGSASAVVTVAHDQRH